MADNNTTKERLKEITDSIETGINELFESDRYMQYLRTMSRFHSYSLNNTLLIAMQKPDATLVAGFNKWRDQFSRHVKKGERGIKIIAPTPYKMKKEQEKVDPVTHAPMLDEHGKVQTEEVEIKIPMFKVVSVFDLSQTEGEPLPALAADLTGDVSQYKIFMEALKRSSPVPIAFEHMEAGKDGYFSSREQRIALREGMSEVRTVSAAIHEIAHSKLHNYEKEKQAVKEDEAAPPPIPKDRRTEEVEAESIAFAVCTYYGIKTDDNSFGYIASWSMGKELSELRSSLELINKTSSALIGDIDRHFLELAKEQDLEQAPEHLAYQVGELYFSIQETEGGYDFSIYDKDYNLLDGGVYDNPDITIYEAIEQIVEDDPISGISALADRENATSIDYDELTAKADQVWQESMRATEKPTISQNSTNIEVNGHTGTWYVIDTTEITGTEYFLLEHEEHGDEAASVIINAKGELVLDDVWNGFNDLEEHLDSLEVVVDTAKDPLPEPPSEEHSYPMPDSCVSIADRNSYGYLDDEMLPLSQERAAELFEQDLTVYLLYEDNTEAMAFEREDIDNHSGLFGIEKADWSALQDYEEMKGDGKLSPEIREQLFMKSTDDAFAIYQLKGGDELRDYRFEGLERLQNAGLEVEHENYDFIYTASLTDFNGNVNSILNQIYEQFNINHPNGFTGHSLSVSDIIALKINDVVSSHYVDSFGFQELPQFLEPSPLVPDNYLTGDRIDTPRGSFSLAPMTKEQMEAAGYGFHHASDNGNYHIMGNGTRAFAIRNEANPLRTAEMSTEQNYNQIDDVLNNQPTVAGLEATVKAGGTISLLDLATAVQAEKQDKRTSVVEQLKSKPSQEKEKPKKAPSIGAEMER